MNTVTVVETPDGQFPGLLARRADQDLSLVFFVARPQSRSRQSVAVDVLGALGVREDLVGTASSSSDDDAHAVTWLAAHRTRTVVVASPQVLDDTALHDLCGLAAAAGTDLLLACDHGHAAPTARRLAPQGARRQDWDETVRKLPAAAVHDPDDDGVDPSEWDRHVALPRADFTTFRAVCRRLLPPERHGHVDRLYAETARRVLNEPAEPSQRGVVETLARDLDACMTLDDCVVVLRATQAGLFRRGWFLSADLDKFLARLVSEDRPMPLTDSQWRSLRGYRAPYRAACCALTALLFSTSELTALTLADADDDAPLMQSAHPLALPYLRAQRLHRYAAGAHPGDVLIDRGAAAVTTATRDARRDLGLRLATNLPAGGAARSDRLATALGLRLANVNATARR